jgi:23S rRNA (cytidine1920-2'-O)/16S rRNA (cytidine1409-2'-O)-methyltransferase
MKQKRARLDRLLIERGLVTSRSKGRVLIMAGEVTVDGNTVFKPATLVSNDSVLEIKAKQPFVSRGGLKLEAAIHAFSITIKDKICADVGACTGGFTDVLLQGGARKIYAIDVGYGQLDWKLRNDDRVIVMERTNARYLDSLPDLINLITIDVSFISLKLILEATLGWLDQDADVIALIKPQFEAGRNQVGKGGVIKDPELHRLVLTDVLNWCNENGYRVRNLMESPLYGSKGNREFLVWLLVGTGAFGDSSKLVDSVV